MPRLPAEMVENRGVSREKRPTTDEAPLIGPVGPPGLHVMSYNIRRRFFRYVPGSPDRWEQREPLLTRLLADERPALLGSQEAMHVQALSVSRALGPDYRRIGYGRNADQRGEGCPIFYDSTRLELTAWRQIALSPTPEEPGSRGFGNHVPRIAVVADFVDRMTGKRIRHINTHLDHVSRVSRERSMALILEQVEESESPVVVTGDMNTGIASKLHRITLASDQLAEAWWHADQRITREWGTFSNYRAPARGRRIDWMLVAPDVSVERIGINTRRFDGRAPSDHEPLQAVLTW